MSNTMCIQPCKFVDYLDFREEPSYGYRWYDGHDSGYNNLWDREHINMSSTEIFRKVYGERSNDIGLYTMLDYLEETKGKIYIGEDIFEWSQIKDIITKHTL